MRNPLRRVSTCTKCRHPRPCACPSIARGHVKAAKRAKGPDPTPRPCPNSWCSRTMFGGVCSNPDC